MYGRVEVWLHAFLTSALGSHALATLLLVNEEPLEPIQQEASLAPEPV
jgi:hypothetical protein